MSAFYILAFDHIFIHWTLCMVLSIVDLYIYFTGQNDQFKASFRTVPENPVLVAKQVLINQFFVVCPIMYLSVDFFPQGSLWELSNIYKIPLTMLFTEFLFYYTHILFHSYYFWQFHQIHHTSTGPYALCTFHCHPLEMALVNVFPILISAVLAGLNFQTMRLWHMVALSNTIVVAHGGYKCFSPNPHDLHHKYRNCNYGIFGFLDNIHGTYRTS